MYIDASRYHKLNLSNCITSVEEDFARLYGTVYAIPKVKSSTAVLFS